RVARLTAVVCGGLAAALAIWFGSGIAALKIFYTLLTAAVLVPLGAGLYAPRETARAGIAGMFGSDAATLRLGRGSGGRGEWGVPSLIFGILFGLIVMSAMSLFERKKLRSKI